LLPARQAMAPIPRPSCALSSGASYHTDRTDSALRRGRDPLLFEHRVDCGLGTFFAKVSLWPAAS
jgi:hypothetical protein